MPPPPAPPSFRHVPVLLEEAVRAWRGAWPASASGAGAGPLFFADATVGGGGHSARLLALEPRARLFCLDRDADAVAASRARLPAERAHVEEGGFAALRQHLRRAGFPPAAGPSPSPPLTPPSPQHSPQHSQAHSPQHSPAPPPPPPPPLLHGILADLGVSSHQLDSAAPTRTTRRRRRP